MRWLFLAIWAFLGLGSTAGAEEGRVLKVLPHFLDQKGRASLSPSLYDRDAYQAQFRIHPEKRAGLRFDIQWKAKVPRTTELKLRVEMRCVANGELPKQGSLEKTVRQTGRFSHWTSITLEEKVYREYGDVTAWRVTLWRGERMLGEEKSFLW